MGRGHPMGGDHHAGCGLSVGCGNHWVAAIPCLERRIRHENATTSEGPTELTSKSFLTEVHTTGNLPDEDGCGATPLMIAAFNGHISVTDTLLQERSLDVLQENNYLSTAVHYAAQRGHAIICRMLVNRSAKVWEWDWEWLGVPCGFGRLFTARLFDALLRDSFHLRLSPFLLFILSTKLTRTSPREFAKRLSRSCPTVVQKLGSETRPEFNQFWRIWAICLPTSGKCVWSEIPPHSASLGQVRP